MKNALMAAGIVAGALMLSSQAVYALPDDSMMKRPFRKMVNDLQLTQRQQAELKAQHEQGKMKEIREKVRAELLKNKPSKAALDECAAQLAGLHKQLIQNRHDHLLKAKKILTPEQFSKLVSHEWRKAGPSRDRGPARRKGKRGPPPHDRD
jgi:Spy/CpxP family protein refolding chaperone